MLQAGRLAGAVGLGMWLVVAELPITYKIGLGVFFFLLLLMPNKFEIVGD
jgi:hypothetical protein